MPATSASLICLLADVYWELSQIKDALGALDVASIVRQTSEDCFWDAEQQRLRGAILLKHEAGTEETAESCFRHALEVSRKQLAKSLELRAATSLGRLLRDQGRRDEALDLLQPLYDWFTEGFNTQDLRDAKALLRELAETR